MLFMVATMSDLLHCKIIAVRIVDKRSILNKVKKDKITIYIRALFEGFAFASGMFFAGFAFTSTRMSSCFAVRHVRLCGMSNSIFEGFAFASGMFFAGFAFTSTRILLFFINIFLLLVLASEN